MDAYCPNCSALCNANAVECSRCHADFSGSEPWKPLLSRPREAKTDDLQVLGRVGLGMLLFPFCLYAIGRLVTGANPIFGLFLLGIPVGALGAGFLFVYVIKWVCRRAKV